MTAGELDESALKSTVAFTGRLACMTRAEAFEVVRQRGGTPSQAVTKRTRLLIVGELGWPLLDDGRPSNKLSRASSYAIPVASERRFLEWIGKAVPDNVHKTYKGYWSSPSLGYWMSALAASAFAIWRVLVRSRSYLRTVFDRRKSFEA
jgi:hypothetical protein